MPTADLAPDVVVPALPWAHREPYAAYFARLARQAPPAAALRRLIPHLDAELDGGERLALWQALWACAQALGPAAVATVARCLDGRHAARLQPLQRAWADPALIEHLARSTQPAGAQADFVPVLLAHHGLDVLGRPEAHAARQPGLVLLAVRAALHAPATRLPAERIATLQAATLAAAERDGALLPQALAQLFELALHAGDEPTATATLAELLNHGHAAALRADRVRAWLDGTAFVDDEDAERPLLLAPALQRPWLQPARWRQPAVLQALHDAVQRPALRQRVLSLAGLLVPAADAPAPAATNDDAWQALQALDSAWLLVDGGADAVPVLSSLMQRDTLAPATLAALHAASARWHGRQGDREGQVLALLQARRQHATPARRRALAALLPGPVPAFGADWREELPYWTRLHAEAEDPWRRLACFQLARLHTEGCLEPHPPRRCQDLPRAHALWTQLAAEPRYAALAAQALRQPEQTLLRPAWRQRGDAAWLWFETPGARAVTIVFSCVATHHSFADVATLRGRLPGQHLMFVRCPDKDWYCDASHDAVHALLRTQVQARFAPDQVSCWYGSMGGHGALKFALAFGWRAITFNPQTDLDLWAAFRPTERALLWGAERHARLADLPLTAWERAPLYLACGSFTADREALSFVIERLRRCRHASVVIEKFDDDNHAGLMSRIAGGAVAPALSRITQRLQQLQQARPAAGARRVDSADQAAFWDALDAARVAKVEVQLRDGQLWWQPSQACGTRR